MDFSLSMEQKVLSDSFQDFLSKECPKELVRELNESDEGYSPGLWQSMADLGWMGLILPNKYGGHGFSFLELIFLLEKMGYYICPGPFFSTVVLGALPILITGTEKQKKEFLPKIARGELRLTLALTEQSAQFDPALMKTRAVLHNDEYAINGIKLFVSDAHLADYFLCVVRTKDTRRSGDGITIFIVDARAQGIECSLLKTMAHDKQCEVVLDRVRAKRKDILGRAHQGWPVVRNILQRAALACGAEMIGGAQAVIDMALKYAKRRIQFNRPIGSFQAIQHHFADMWTDIHGSRILLYRAAWKISQGIPASMEVAMAKAKVGEAFRHVTALGHQIFGAIGFTMEHDMHLYYRRAIAGDLAFGNGDFHRENVAQELGL